MDVADSRERQRRYLVLTGVGVGVAITLLMLLLGQGWSFLNQAELSAYDLQFNIRGSSPAPANVVVVGSLPWIGAK